MAFNQGHALVIGVGSYKFDKFRSVPITVRDAEAVKKILTDPDTCGYPEKQVNLLHDGTATTQGVVDALEKLAEQTYDSDDVVLIYFAGHGAFGTDNHYYLATHDAKFLGRKQIPHGRDPNELIIVPDHGLSQKTLAEKLKDIKAENVLMIFNACHSGSLQSQSEGTSKQGVIEGRSLPSITASALLSTGTGRVVISACKPDQLSSFVDEDENLTWFTDALADGLKGESMPAEGFISAFNLYNYTYKEVTKTAESNDSSQDPVITVLEVAGSFPVAFAGSSVHGPGEAEAESLQQAGGVYEVSEAYCKELLTKIEQENLVQGDYIKGDKVMRDKIEQQINIEQVDMHSATASGKGGTAIQIEEVSSGFVNTNFQVLGSLQQAAGDIININQGQAAGGSVDRGSVAIADLFLEVMQQVQTLPDDWRVVVQLTVEKVRKKVEAVQTADPPADTPEVADLEEWLRRLLDQEPDIAEAVLSGLAAPGSGIVSALREMNGRMKKQE